MEHVAIMKKSWGFLPKILTGEKKIESRWYKHKAAPWGRIAAGDTVYFKNAGEPVTASATVRKVFSFDDLTPKKAIMLLKKYGKDDGIAKDDRAFYAKQFADKRYCLLIFLKDAKKIKPFMVDKTGFGAMAAWISARKLPRLPVKP